MSDLAVPLTVWPGGLRVPRWAVGREAEIPGCAAAFDSRGQEVRRIQHTRVGPAHKDREIAKGYEKLSRRHCLHKPSRNRKQCNLILENTPRQGATRSLNIPSTSI